MVSHSCFYFFLASSFLFAPIFIKLIPSFSYLYQFDFAINGLLSMNMVVSFLIAFVLDNTVPGSKQERGVYKWSTSEDLATDASSQASYKLPSRVANACCWAKCLGLWSQQSCASTSILIRRSGSWPLPCAFASFRLCFRLLILMVWLRFWDSCSRAPIELRNYISYTL